MKKLYKILNTIGFKLDDNETSLNRRGLYKRETYTYESFYVNIEERNNKIQYYFYDENVSPYYNFPNEYLGDNVDSLIESLRKTFRKLRVDDLLDDLN